MISARREPLLWLQLLSGAVLPLEFLLLLLLLAGVDPGPVPALERLLAWAIGVLTPAVLLWRQPGDPFSLLMIQAPLRARSTNQRTLVAAPLFQARAAVVVAAVLLLPALWWLDAAAPLAGPMAPLQEASRLVVLLLAAPLLALMVWQIQQLVQAIALLMRSEQVLQTWTPLSEEQLQKQRLSPGLPLLLLEPFVAPRSSGVDPPGGDPVEVDLPVAVEPEHGSEQDDSPGLDQQVG